MKFPIGMTAGLAGYILKNKMRPRPEWQKNAAPENDAANPFRILPPKTGTRRQPHPMIAKRFPIVLMLEPLHACNLTCTGCGRIREYESTITERVPLEECLAAVDECGAPVVSICGGEPMMYPQIGELTAGILQRNRHIYLCTNGMFIKKRLHEFTPDKRFYFNVHLDGMEKSHDIAVEKEGVFKAAIEGIRLAKAAGFQVCTNTTVYKETDMREIEELFEYLKQFGVDGHQIAPAYGYSAVNDREIFLTREDIYEKFKDIDRLAKKYAIRQTPMYLEFLKGERELPCTAWGNPTYNVKGWKGPCYLITDGHYKTFEALMTQTPWETYGKGNDPRCEHCMVHCGFEPSAALGINAGIADNLKMLAWTLR
jgi:hopanoid biosynthesis associated radical SAM protein HpnH